MIKVKNGRCTVKAKGVPYMMSEFAIVCRSVYKTLQEEGLAKADAVEFMKHNLELGFCETEAQLKEYMKKSISDLLFRQKEEKGE